MFGIKRWAAAVLFLAAMTAAGGAERMLWHPYANGLGAGGYDVVAYFADGKAAKGREEFSADHGGQTWRFASDEHRQQFLAAPQNYLPQYGGYCAYAASLGALAFGDPEEWTVRGGKLYFNYNAPTRARWEAEAQQHIVSADRNWPSLADKQLANTESDN